MSNREENGCNRLIKKPNLKTHYNVLENFSNREENGCDRLIKKHNLKTLIINLKFTILCITVSNVGIEVYFHLKLKRPPDSATFVVLPLV